MITQSKKYVNYLYQKIKPHKNHKYFIPYTTVSILYREDLPPSSLVDGWFSNDIGKPHAKG